MLLFIFLLSLNCETKNMKKSSRIKSKAMMSVLSVCMLLILVKTTNSIRIDGICPRMLHKVFDGYAPVGNITAGICREYLRVSSLTACVIECCLQKSECNVAFVLQGKCYHMKCKNDEVCLPLKRNSASSLKMVLVNPTTSERTWEDLMSSKNLDYAYKLLNDSTEINLSEHVYPDRSLYNQYQEEVDRQIDEALDDQTYGYPRYNNAANLLPQYTGDLMPSETKLALQLMRDEVKCTVAGSQRCLENELCVQPNPQIDIGICQCNVGFTRNYYQNCVPVNSNYNTPEDSDDKLNIIIKHLGGNREDPVAQSKTAPMETGQNPNVQHLSVSALSKTIQLPENRAMLSAFPVPDERLSGVAYNYTWSLISQPNGDINGTMSDKTKSEIELTNLSEGLYRFKVVVSGNGWLGETFANITVLPQKRYNKSPIVIIKPAQQIIKEPTNSAILDGSASTDDDKIKSWHWDLIQGPMNYQPPLTDTSTLQLTNLTLPGNYTFKLTVTDSDNSTNSTTANITVLKATDYPPSANAGQPVILYLPQNNVTLDGSLSTDDHDITAWEWTKDQSDVSKAVDMQDTRTPHLRLSNLEEGIYTFVLKVTDASNQSNTAKVSVFVKRPSNKPPEANAGLNQTINLPQTWVILNATNSTHDAKINSYKWKQISGPNTANIIGKDTIAANATALTIGTYVFEVCIVDASKNNATARVTINVVQEKNTPPVAHAGGDQTITLPTNTIYMNGSQSSDDLGINRWEWERDGTSLAIGTIVGHSDKEPVLVLTNIVAGRYVFKLTVTDVQGLSSSDTVSVIVHPDPLLMNLIETTLTTDVTVLTQAEILSLQQKLVLLLGNNMKVILRDLRMEPKTGEAILIFYVEQVTGAKENRIVNGFEVESILKEKLWSGNDIVGMPIFDIRTTVCQNKCSGHGTCNSESRACMCDTFWMPNLYYFWGISEANCDWSILYVVIGIFIIFIMTSGVCWALTCYCRTEKPRSRSKTQKYALLESQDTDRAGANLNRSMDMSESDTDSDVLFQTNSQSKPNGILRNNGLPKNGHKNYTTTRLGRRIKA